MAAHIFDQSYLFSISVLSVADPASAVSFEQPLFRVIFYVILKLKKQFFVERFRTKLALKPLFDVRLTRRRHFQLQSSLEVPLEVR